MYTTQERRPGRKPLEFRSGERRAVRFWVDAEEARALEMLARTADSSVTAILRRAVAAYLAGGGTPPASPTATTKSTRPKIQEKR